MRDRPWPPWLYPVNAVLLGGVGLAALIESSVVHAAVVCALAAAAVSLNVWVGRRMGTPFVIPTSRGFQGCVALSAVFLVAAMAARDTDSSWIVIAGAVGATVSYLLGSVIHYRSTCR